MRRNQILLLVLLHLKKDGHLAKVPKSATVWAVHITIDSWIFDIQVINFFSPKN